MKNDTIMKYQQLNNNTKLKQHDNNLKPSRVVYSTKIAYSKTEILGLFQTQTKPYLKQVTKI